MNKNAHADLRLQAVIENATDGIITIDNNGIVETINPAAARIFGYAPKEVIGQNIKMLMPQPYRKEHDQYIHNYKATGVRKIIGIGREVRGQKKDGTTFPMRLAVSEVKFDGKKRIFTGIVHDLSEVKDAEQKILDLNHKLSERNEQLEARVIERTEKLASVVDKLLDTNEQLEKEIQERLETERKLIDREHLLEASLTKEKELNELKSRFVSMASHEFRTPLSTILSSIELVEAYENDEQIPKRERHILRIKKSVNTLTEILKDFLSLSRLEEGKIEANPLEFDFFVFCEETLEEIRALLKNGQQIQHQHEGAEKMVYLDPKMLKNILINLLSNAIKYSGENTTIACHTSFDGQQLKMVITDQGKGIPIEDQPHLFDRFFRARNVENIQGTGLGLNIVKRYLDLMKGNIQFDSELGKGTTFVVTIPQNHAV